MPVRHVVKIGECLNSIADQYGFFPGTIWDHPDNAAIKARRQPGVLGEGDVLVVPDAGQKAASVATDARHCFKRRGVPALFRLQLLAGGEPRAGLPFSLDLGGSAVSGATDSHGWIRAWIPPGIKSAGLTVGEGQDEEHYQIDFGQLEPVDTVKGVQARLKNLGFDCEVTGELDEATEAAIELFQEEIDHPDPSGELDEFTRRQLEARHGGT